MVYLFSPEFVSLGGLYLWKESPLTVIMTLYSKRVQIWLRIIEMLFYMPCSFKTLTIIALQNLYVCSLSLLDTKIYFLCPTSPFFFSPKYWNGELSLFTLFMFGLNCCCYYIVLALLMYIWLCEHYSEIIFRKQLSEKYLFEL